MGRHPCAGCFRLNMTVILKPNLCATPVHLCELTGLGPCRQAEVRQLHFAWCVYLVEVTARVGRGGRILLKKIPELLDK